MKGVVESQDLSLNSSREMLQHDRQLRAICNNIEKKIKQELKKLLENGGVYAEMFKKQARNYLAEAAYE